MHWPLALFMLDLLLLGLKSLGLDFFAFYVIILDQGETESPPEMLFCYILMQIYYIIYKNSYLYLTRSGIFLLSTSINLIVRTGFFETYDLSCQVA